MKRLLTLLLLISFNYLFAQLQPTDSLALLKVLVVTADDDQPAQGEHLVFTNNATGVTYEGVSGGDGKFEILIPEGVKYNIKVTGFGHDESKVMEIPLVDGPVVMNFTQKVSRVSKFELKVNFDVNSAHITEDSYGYIDQLFDFMEGKKSTNIEIGGHTDSDGSDEANMTLSQKRAEAVKKYLVDKGIDAARIKAKGYGESIPIASNETPEGKRKNRRTEITVLSNH